MRDVHLAPSEELPCTRALGPWSSVRAAGTLGVSDESKGVEPVRSLVLYVCALLMVAVLAACDDGVVFDNARDVEGNGVIVTEDRTVADFERIILAGEGAVIVTEGESASLTVETDDNLLTYIDTDVDGRTLEIATEPGIDIEPTDSVVYRVTARHVTGVTLSGAGRFELGECDAKAFSVVLSGAGEIAIGRLAAEDLDVEITGAGAVVVAGKVVAQDVSIPGAGSYEGRDLESGHATVRTSGLGSATVWATDTLDARVTGVGDIEYFGSPRVTSSVSGVGNITHRGDA